MAPTDSAAPPHLAPVSADDIDAFRRSGYLVLRGLLGDVVTRLDRSYQSLDMEEEGDVVRCDVFYDTGRTGCDESPRLMVAGLRELEGFAWLHDDPRLSDVATTLLGAEPALLHSNASMFRCDTRWHEDSHVTGADDGHVVLMAYLDTLHAGNGALRVIPASHRPGAVRDELRASLVGAALFGRPAEVDRPEEIRCRVLDVEPGDVIALNPSSLHASFGGSDRRRVVIQWYGPPGEGLSLTDPSG